MYDGRECRTETERLCGTPAGARSPSRVTAAATWSEPRRIALLAFTGILRIPFQRLGFVKPNNSTGGMDPCSVSTFFQTKKQHGVAAIALVRDARIPPSRTSVRATRSLRYIMRLLPSRVKREGGIVFYGGYIR